MRGIIKFIPFVVIVYSVIFIWYKVNPNEPAIRWIAESSIRVCADAFGSDEAVLKTLKMDVERKQEELRKLNETFRNPPTCMRTGKPMVVSFVGEDPRETLRNQISVLNREIYSVKARIRSKQK